MKETFTEVQFLREAHKYVMFTSQKLLEIFPKTPVKTLDLYVIPLNKTIDRFEINTQDRAAAFIAQVGHESGYLTRTSENLNYSHAGLLKTFKKYFTTKLAARYARKPEMIASRVYANRMGNGNEASRDGWTFRGRGLIQITGRDNYTRLAAYLGMTIPKTIEYLETPEGAAISAGWFWFENDLNDFADSREFEDLTRKINGGLNGLADRIELWERAKNVL